jgi:hypothetical protein
LLPRGKECGGAARRKELLTLTLECIFASRETKHDRAFGSLAPRSLRRAIYHGIPPSGMKPDIYGIGLWILSSGVLVVSAVILVVSLVSPWGIHPTKW